MPQFENLSFPLAKTLEVRLRNTVKANPAVASNSQSAIAPTPLISKEQVASAAQSLLRLFPTVVNVDMTVCSISNSEPNYIQLYEWLATELFRGRVNSVEIWSWPRDVVLSLDLHDIHGLTRITHGVNVSCATFARLAYLNAGTLQTLGLVLSGEENWLNLIFGETGEPVVYANLSSLTLWAGKMTYAETWGVIEDVEPFPALSALDIYDGYPFGDDLLFRGNGNTLQSLCLPFRAIASNTLGRHNVLGRSRVARMNYFQIGKVTSADEEFMAANAGTPIRQQIHRILEVSLSLTILSDSDSHHMYSAICTASNATAIQSLDFANMAFDASQIIRTVAALPSLVSFTCSVSGCGPEIEAILTSERPSTLHAKHYPLSRRFMKLCVAYNASASAKSLAQAAMLLAVVCPSLRTVEVLPTLRNEFSREIAWAMLNSVYRPYADRLRDLIYWE
ncbi:hypothetical protein GGF42_001772 [Coemansia sp. RSA 2424]|nr:hypothetical protein GGF42_001772 [Coemansia sp. RSA 2424]